MNALTRNIGTAIGISLMQYQLTQYSAASRADLVQGVRPDNPVLQYARPGFDFNSVEALAGMKAEISQQAAMVGNISIYHLVFVISLAVAPLVLLMRPSKTGKIDAKTLPIGE